MNNQNNLKEEVKRYIAECGYDGLDEEQLIEKIKKWVMDNTYLDSRGQLVIKHYRTAYAMIEDIKQAMEESKK